MLSDVDTRRVPRKIEMPHWLDFGMLYVSGDCNLFNTRDDQKTIQHMMSQAR